MEYTSKHPGPLTADEIATLATMPHWSAADMYGKQNRYGLFDATGREHASCFMLIRESEFGPIALCHADPFCLTGHNDVHTVVVSARGWKLTTDTGELIAQL